MADNGVSYHVEDGLRNRLTKTTIASRSDPSVDQAGTVYTTATTTATATSAEPRITSVQDHNHDDNGFGEQKQSDSLLEDHEPKWPPPETRSRASEFYGFVAWTSTYLAFGIYLLWAFLPDECIIWLGVTWYPSREWAILVPAWSIMAVLFTYFAYFCLALAGTPALDDINSIVDGHTSFPTLRSGTHNPYLASTEPDAIPELYDIPISMVNRVLYLQGVPREDD